MLRLRTVKWWVIYHWPTQVLVRQPFARKKDAMKYVRPHNDEVVFQVKGNYLKPVQPRLRMGKEVKP